MEPRLAGRDSETATLASILAEAERGVGQLVLISGEPGIGKTRLAEHAVDTAMRRGFTVLTGQADPLQSGLAYAPIVAALRHQTDATDLAGLPDLGRLLPDPRLPLPEPGGDPALNRTRMFEAVLTLLRRLAANNPVLLFVDDLHWADHGTIELVHYLGHGTASGQLVVIGACRPPHQGSRLADLATMVRRHDHGIELALGPLNDNDVAVVAHDVLGATPPPDLLHELATRAKGVPLFVTALAKHTGHGPLPVIVRDVVLSRMHTLTEPERTLIDLIAVAGTCATLDVLKAVGGHTDALHTLLRLGHIKEHLNGHELIYQVAHPLYAEVAYAELTEVERRRLHARLATTIDRFAPDNVMSLAPHYRDAGDYVDRQRAIEVLATAGERALNVYAASEAVDYLSRALSRARDDRPSQVPALLDGLGMAYQGAGMLSEATEIWSERLAVAEAETDTERQATLRTQLAMLESERGNPNHVDAHLTALLHLKGDQDIEASALRITIACRQWPRQRAFALHHQVIEAYRDDPRPSGQAMHYNAAGHLASMRGRFDEALLLLERSVGLANEGVLPFQPQRILAGVRLLTGDIPGALTTISEEAAANASFVFPSSSYTMRMVLSSAGYFAGDLLGSLAELDKDIATSTQVGMHRMTVRILAFRAFLLAELGRVDEAAKSFAQAQPGRAVLQDSWGIAKTAIALHSGHPEQAPPLDPAEFVFRDPIINALRLLGAGQAAIAAKDWQKACEISEFLRTTGRTAPLLDALADRHEGLITGKSEMLRKSARSLAAMGAPLLAAQADLEAAELDPEHDTILRCLRQFQEAGVAPWLDRAKRLARKHNIFVPLEKRAGVLSKRESEVVQLLAAGLSNADIAARLFLSERTVESHLGSCYRKLGITSRLRLAQWAQGNT